MSHHSNPLPIMKRPLLQLQRSDISLEKYGAIFELQRSDILALTRQWLLRSASFIYSICFMNLAFSHSPEERCRCEAAQCPASPGA
jgi:hypothetical protein